MKPLVIYHASCADGYGAAFAAWAIYEEELIMTKPTNPDKAKLIKFIKSLRRLAKEVDEQGILNVEIEDGELAYMLNHAADLLENKK